MARGGVLAWHTPPSPANDATYYVCDAQMEHKRSTSLWYQKSLSGAGSLTKFSGNCILTYFHPAFRYDAMSKDNLVYSTVFSDDYGDPQEEWNLRPHVSPITTRANLILTHLTPRIHFLSKILCDVEHRALSYFAREIFGRLSPPYLRILEEVWNSKLACYLLCAIYSR